MKKLIITLILILLSYGTSEATVLQGVFSGMAAISGNWGSYSYHKCLNGNTTVTGANVSGSLSDFPIAVHINASSWTTDERTHLALAQTDGKRVRFFASDLTTVLPYEVEYYNESGDIVTDATYWVKAGTVTGNDLNNNLICIAYGNAPIDSDQSNASAVWDDNFKGVWHFGEISGDHADSTANAKTGTRVENTQTDGQVAKAQSFDGTNDRINHDANAGFYDNLTVGTLSFWAMWDSSDADVLVGFFGISKAYPDQFEIIAGSVTGTYADESLWIWFMSGGSTKIDAYFRQGHTFLKDGVLHKIDWVVGSSSNALYVDGTAQILTYATGNASTGNYFLNAGTMTQMNFAARGYNNIPSLFLKGKIDEVRISNIVRTEHWFKLEYYSMLKTSYNGDEPLNATCTGSVIPYPCCTNVDAGTCAGFITWDGEM